MTAVLTDIKIANMALAKYGAGAIQTFAATTPAGSKMALLYHMVIRGLLSEYPWEFTKSTKRLARLHEPRPYGGNFLAEGWRFAFELPAGCLAPPDKYLVNPLRAQIPLTDFEVQEGKLYCNREEVYAVARFEADPAVWPPYFVQAAVACLAAETVMAISGNSGQLQSLQETAWGPPEAQRSGGLLGTAKIADARNIGPVSLRHNPLLEARFS